MRITLIGAGNLATNLAKALKTNGHDIVEIWSRTEESARTLSNVVGCSFSFGDIDIKPGSDIYIISVKDSVLEQTAARFIPVSSESIWCHTAGTMSVDILSSKGAKHIGVFYPMQTFSKTKEVYFSKIPIFIEAKEKEAEVLNALKELACSISQQVFELDSEGRRSLHLAAVFACNFANHCYSISESLLAERGIPFSVMLPLVEETSEKVHIMSPKEAQTGPAIRHDHNVMNRQREMLADKPELQHIYDILSHSIENL